MPPHLFALCFDANDPRRLARFWAGVLGWEMADDPPDGFALLPSDDTGFRLRFLPTQEQKTGPNQMHFDLTSTSLEDQQQTVARALELGARHIDVGQLPEEEHVVLADPEGNEFCVIEPGNNFLADCGFIGALSSDGSQAGRVLLERGAGLAAGLGPGPGDRDPLAARRSEDHVGRSAGARRRQGRTGCTSTSRRLPTATSRRRSTVSSPSGRPGSTSARARSAGS